MTIKELTDSITQNLQPLYDKREAAAIAKLYVGHRTGLPGYEMALRYNESVPEPVASAYHTDIKSLKSGIPIQHILGVEEFYGLRFAVSPEVLIPRPETEELVMSVMEACKGREVSIWDIGTGSGCIAVTLSKMLPKAQVFATDISEKALKIAVKNAIDNAAEVTFARHDMLSAGVPFGDRRFDIIVSNPPYIPLSDKPSMHINVAGFDPELALFVPDDDKFIFYRAIAKIGRRCLKTDGRIFAETYHLYTSELLAMFRSEGYEKTEAMKDINGKSRFICAERP